MTNDTERVSLKACALPGTIRVTGPALELAVRFQAAVPAGHIATFSWHDGERVRASKDSPWVDNGPGMGLGAYKIEQIPEAAVFQSGSLRYAVLVRKDVLDNYPEKVVDLNDRGKPILR